MLKDKIYVDLIFKKYDWKEIYITIVQKASLEKYHEKKMKCSKGYLQISELPTSLNLVI